MIELDKLKELEDKGKKIEDGLIAIRKSVGAKLGEFNIVHREFVMDAEEIQELEQLKPGDPIIINGEYHHVYIKDHSYYGKSEHDQEVKEHPAHCFTSGNKVHFYYCETLSDMRGRGGYDRYRATRKISNSKIIELRHAENVKTRLAWCQNCLHRIFPGGGFDRRKIAQNGDAQKLMAAVKAYHDGKKDLGKKHAAKFRKYNREPIPIGASHVKNLKGEFDPAGYPSDWDEISAAYRKKCGYKCADCSVDCSAHHHLIDAHHKSRDKSDCRDDNLQCLCKLCHAEQHRHEHYRVEEAHKEEILRLREE